MSEGLKGYEQRTRDLKAALDLSRPDSIDRYVFYKAVLIVIAAVRQFAGRYAALAGKMAQQETDSVRKAELEAMSRICARVPYEKAASFREAVQSVWFIQLILQIESNGHSLSYGRFDQYMLYPYYKKDIDQGIISQAEALELLKVDGLEPEDLIAVRERLATKGSGKVARYIYKDEFDQERTWTGQGRTPKPIQDALNQGSKLEDFLIK